MIVEHKDQISMIRHATYLPWISMGITYFPIIFTFWGNCVLWGKCGTGLPASKRQSDGLTYEERALIVYKKENIAYSSCPRHVIRL